MHPKVLIVGPVPYSKQSTSRSLNTYFANWEKENLAQVFSHRKKPTKGHCGKLYQITDVRLLKRRFNRKLNVGKEFVYDELSESIDIIPSDSKTLEKMYVLGSRKSSTRHLLRKFLWKKRYWNTPQFNRWLEDFKPEAVFLSFSYDFFLSEIALYVARKFNIPIICSVVDDYCFDGSFSLSVSYHIYRWKFRRLVRKVMAYPGDLIYISDKIRDKYNNYFNRHGKTLHLTSDIKRRDFKAISKMPKITYFGNIRMGRNKSLVDIANAMYEINQEFKLDIYSNEEDPKVIKVLTNCPSIRYNGTVPYQKVQEEMYSSDITLIVEGFKAKDVSKSRYSLSTKVADSLRSGVNILAYGSIECGVIEYLKDCEVGLVVTKKHELKEKISSFLKDYDLQKIYYDNTLKVTENNHVLEKNSKMFDDLVVKAIKEYSKK